MTVERTLLEAAFGLHKAGRAAEAAAAYREILAIDPHHPKALLLFGMLQAAGNATGEAEDLLRRFLDSSTDHRPFDRGTALLEMGKLRQAAFDDRAAVPLFEAAAALITNSASLYCALCRSLHRLGRFQAALDAIDRAIALDPGFAPAQMNRGLILKALLRLPEALAAFRQALAINPQWGEAWANLGDTCQASGEVAEAETALRQAIACDDGNFQARFQLASLLERQKRFEEAKACHQDAARRHGIRVHPCTGGAPRARLLLIGGAGSCNLSPEFLLDRRRYDLITLYLRDGEADLSALAKRLPPFDIAFNMVADVDRGGEFVPLVSALCGHFSQPLLNPPDDRLERTRRDRGAALLEGIPELLVPATHRRSRAELTELAQAAVPLERPILVRPAGAHGGDDFDRIERLAQLEEYLSRTDYDEYYLSDYCEYRSQDGFYRKYRFVLIDREVYPYHLVVGSEWLLHYFRAGMAGEKRFQREEEAFLADWQKVLPAAAATALHQIARRLDLDFAGVDCGLTADGRLLLFEANPCMLVHLRDSPEDFPYKHQYVPRIAQAMDQMVSRRMASAFPEA